MAPTSLYLRSCTSAVGSLHISLLSVETETAPTQQILKSNKIKVKISNSALKGAFPLNRHPTFPGRCAPCLFSSNAVRFFQEIRGLYDPNKQLTLEPLHALTWTRANTSITLDRIAILSLLSFLFAPPINNERAQAHEIRKKNRLLASLLGMAMQNEAELIQTQNNAKVKKKERKLARGRAWYQKIRYGWPLWAVSLSLLVDSRQ